MLELGEQIHRVVGGIVLIGIGLDSLFHQPGELFSPKSLNFGQCDDEPPWLANLEWADLYGNIGPGAGKVNAGPPGGGWGKDSKRTQAEQVCNMNFVS
jgi:hypothetical protein